MATPRLTYPLQPPPLVTLDYAGTTQTVLKSAIAKLPFTAPAAGPVKGVLIALALLGAAALPARAQQPQAACTPACTVTLPGAAWDRLGAALGDSIQARQDLYGELARQIQEQRPKAAPAAGSGTESSPPALPPQAQP